MMRYMVFTTDYDGTIANENRVPDDVIKSLARLKASGRKLILVTGRALEQLKDVFPEHTMFDLVVAENGAVIYDPSTLTTRLLADSPPEVLIDQLKLKNIPYSTGQVLVATWEPHHIQVLEAIKESGVEYQVIFNKGAVMVLPPGINKAIGLNAALRQLNMHEHNTVAMGDAENDNAMLQACECAISVANALPQVKAISDWTTKGSVGDGVRELISELIQNDLATMDERLSRHYLRIGEDLGGDPVSVSPYGSNILLAGSSSSGKTTLCGAFIEKLIYRQYQFCLIDPEGDYQGVQSLISIGDENQPPQVQEILQVLTQAEESVAVCLLAVPFDERPYFFRELLHAILHLREQTGHPHFLIIDEAHHLVPRDFERSFFNFPDDFTGFFAITTQPGLICTDLLRRFNVVMTMGETPVATLESFACITKTKIDIPPDLPKQKGTVLFWTNDNVQLRFILSDLPTRLLMRHKRKYATGDMGMNSFYFRGPGCKLCLKEIGRAHV